MDEGGTLVGLEQPRTRLEQILGQRHLTLEQFRREYATASGTELSERQAYRWVSAELHGLPHPHARAALERLFGEPVTRLLGPPYGRGATTRSGSPATARGTDREDREGQVLAEAAHRAREFLQRTEVSNVGAETLDEIGDEVRRLVLAYQVEPLERLLGDIADVQARTMALLQGRQRPHQTRQLYLLAGVASGLMGKSSHDLGAPHDALTQARVAYSCADSADHDGLRAWARGRQALVGYWSGRLAESIEAARRGTDAARRSRGTSAVWLAVSQARSLAAAGRSAEASAALDQAVEARERVEGDELDELGGLCTFGRPRQLYYAADTLVWSGAAASDRVEALAGEAFAGYAAAPSPDRAFGDLAGIRCASAIARLARGEVDGAIDAMAPVLELPPAQRIHGVVTSVENVQRALSSIGAGRTGEELTERLTGFTAGRLALPA